MPPVPPDRRTSRSFSLGRILLDRDKVGQAIRDWNYTKEKIAHKNFAENFAATVRIGLKTVRRVLNGQCIYPSSAARIAAALKTNVRELLAPGELHRFSQTDVREPRIQDWLIEGALPLCFTTANGLECQLYRLRHEYLSSRYARGKRYLVSDVPTQDRREMLNYLVRHAEVCGRFRGHPHIAMNLEPLIKEQEDSWWVIDEWIPGRTLAEILDAGPLDPKKLPRVMHQIALGLEALHGAGIVRRELSPRFIVLREGEETVVLTDFELAKLLDHSPTVRPADKKKWSEVDYRAPEVGSPNIDASADLYSWGRILVRATTGELPPGAKGKDAEILAASKLPKRVKEIGLACIARPCSNRPKGIYEVLKALKGWEQ